MVETVASYNMQHFNSPNDLVFHPKNNDLLYFTDPPYGLPLRNLSDPLVELKYDGIYLYNFTSIFIS